MTVRPVASLSLDADNLWSYLKTRGDDEWRARPSFLHLLGPRLRELWGELDITATVFVVGHDAATDSGGQFVGGLVAAGHEIGNHSYEHEPWLHEYSTQELDSELERTEDAIVAAGAPRPSGFRGPGYSLSPDLLRLLSQRGYDYDCTTLPTWIGPLARAYYFRASGLSKAERKQRNVLFGSAREGLRRNKTYRWDGLTGSDLLEIPVTTIPGLRTPFHISYLLSLYEVRPSLMRGYFRAALRACQVSGTSPSILMHPLDLLDGSDAPGLAFFPGMALPAKDKLDVCRWALRELGERFDVVGTGEHARRVRPEIERVGDIAKAGPKNAR